MEQHVVSLGGMGWHLPQHKYTRNATIVRILAALLRGLVLHIQCFLCYIVLSYVVYGIFMTSVTISITNLLLFCQRVPKKVGLPV